jgi:Flp pilus assembly protein TadG
MALVFPVFMLILGGIIQMGLVFWGQNTLTQVVRDAGRWAATQASCTTPGTVVTTANQIAAQSSLIGYTPGSWVAGTGLALNTVGVSWVDSTGKAPGDAGADIPCPPVNNQKVWWVTVTVTAQVPVFMPFVPDDGRIRSSTRFRIEPAPG